MKPIALGNAAGRGMSSPASRGGIRHGHWRPTDDNDAGRVLTCEI